MVAGRNTRAKRAYSLEAMLGGKLLSFFLRAGKVARVKHAGKSRLLATSDFCFALACFARSTIPECHITPFVVFFRHEPIRPISNRVMLFQISPPETIHAMRFRMVSAKFSHSASVWHLPDNHERKREINYYDYDYVDYKRCYYYAVCRSHWD